MSEVPNGSVPVVRAAGVRKTYPHPARPVRALRGADLTIERGEFVAVMGASGSGKSTLLHIIGGLDRPDEGEVMVGGEDLTRLGDRQLTRFRRRRVGVVFQFFNLVPTLSALENVCLPMSLDGGDRATMRTRATELLELVGLADRWDHRPNALSGGEQQRVAVARALLMEPDVVLADEPTGNLDSANAEIVWGLFDRLSREMNATLCVVSHEPAVATHADRIVVLKDGCVVGQIRPEECGRDPALVATRYQELAS